MARLRPILIRPILPLQRLLLPRPQLAPNLLLRPHRRAHRTAKVPRPRRRSPHVVRADRSRELGRYGMATGWGGGGGAVEWTPGRQWAEQESVGCESEIGGDEGEDGGEGGEGGAGADGVLYAG